MKLFWLITLLVLPALLCTFIDCNKYMANAIDMHDENENGEAVTNYSDDEATVNTFLQFELPARMPVDFLDFGLDKFVQSIIPIIAYSIIPADGGFRPSPL